MQFDSQGNLYLYEPGAGFSGRARRVIQMGSPDQVVYADTFYDEVEPDDLDIKVDLPIEDSDCNENQSTPTITEKCHLGNGMISAKKSTAWDKVKAHRSIPRKA